MNTKKALTRKRTAFDIDRIAVYLKLLSLLVLLLGFTIFGHAANEQAQPIIGIDHVEATKTPFPNAIHITANEMEELMNGNDPYGLLNYLSLQTGLTFRSTGDFGAEDWFTVRGFGRDNSRLTLVLVDGRPINLVGNHTVEFGDIPMNMIETITIYPGPVPSQYGGFQFVVDITTQCRSNETMASASAGSLNSFWVNTKVARDGQFYYRFNLDGTWSDGQTGQQLLGVLDHFTYDDRNDRAILPSVMFGYEFNPDLDLSLNVDVFDVKKVFSSEPFLGERQSRERQGQSFTLTLQPTRNGNTDYRVLAYFFNESEWLNTQFPENLEYNVNWGTHKRQRFGLNGFYRQPVIENMVWLRAGAELHSAQGESDNDYVFFQYETQQTFYGAYLQAETSPWEGAFFQAGGRIDGQSYIDDIFVSPSLAFSQNLLSDLLQLYGTYGISSRWLPTNKVNTFKRGSALFPPPLRGSELDQKLIRPTLDPKMERFTGVDAGIRGFFFDKRLSARVNYFYLSNKGTAGAPLWEVRPTTETVIIPLGPPPVPPLVANAALVSYDRNLPGREINEGIEIMLDARPMTNIRLFASATYTLRSETVLDDGVVGRSIDDFFMMIPGQPPVLNQQEIDNSVGHFIVPYVGRSVIPGAYDLLANFGAAYTFANGANANLLLRYRSDSADPLMKFNMDPQVDKIKAFLLADIGGSFPIVTRDGYRVTATARVSNLFDTQYSTFVHYPMVGRFITAGLNFNLL
ncbi:MAG: TonB-dependent receptor [Bacteroidales bacterium]